MYYLSLASKSPRRSEILKKAKFIFQTFSIEISENLSENMSLDDALKELSRRKAEAVIDSFRQSFRQPAVVLAADTVVSLSGKILEKPESEEESIRHLESLSGKSHEVKTSYCLYNLHIPEIITDIETSTVTFRDLTKEEMLEYSKTSEPYDKAGGYGIQGAGRKFVKSFTGSFSNIMGLPIERIEQKLLDLGWVVFKEG